MAFELVVEMKSKVEDLRRDWQRELESHGFSLELLPTFDANDWAGGFLPIKVASLPDKYLFGLPKVVQISGFEVSFGSGSAHFRTASGRTLAELVLQCYGAACLAVITNGVYYDLQASESFEAAAAIARADAEIMAYNPYIDDSARVQHPFTQWSDFS